LSNFKLVDATVDLSGASSAAMHFDGKLDVVLSGASSLRYSGNPEIISSNITGGSKFENL
jgi:hypothetical protein